MIELLAPLILLAAGLAYVRRSATLAARGQPVPWWRLLCFGLGLLILLVTDVPPLAGLAEELVVAHMVQHLLIGDLAALGIAVGLTGPLLQPLLRLPGLGWLRFLANPLIALPLWILDLYLWHLGALYQGVLDNSALHFAQHFGFLTFGVIMWMPVVGPLPTPGWFGNGAKLIYVVLVRFSGAVLANILIWSGSPLYPDYGPTEAEHGISALADQGAAGAVMMVEGGLVTLGLIAWLFFRWARQDTERQELLDLAERKGVPLDPDRAGRAAAAGRTEELAARIRRQPASR